MRRLRIVLSIAALATSVGACGGGSNPPSMQEPVTDPNGDGTDDHPNLAGSVLFSMLCTSCHGERGEGVTAPALDRWTRTRDELVATIDTRMPLGEPDKCKGECAELVADFILNELQTAAEPAICEGIVPPERRLRLLTRREYRATVRDLLHVDRMPCGTDGDCEISSESCDQGACAADPCRVHTFIFDPHGQSHGSIVVAGDFNGWASNASAGAWPMSFAPSIGLWILKHELADGAHAYKLVLDGATWIADPANPSTAPDGFGGQNSLVDVRCVGVIDPAPVDVDPTASFPIESRPSGFAYDDSAAAGLATEVHVTEWMAAAERLAGAAVARIERLLPCDPAADEHGCAETFVRSFGKRAFRRPLDAAEIAKYAALVRNAPSFKEGIAIAIQVMLSSPSFLYRSEIGVETAPGAYRLSAWEIASALSYAFWGTMPDQTLFDAAEQGALDDAAGIEAQARRLLADPRSRELAGVFAAEWLGIESVLTTNKHAALYPEFDDALRRSMLAETMRFAEHVIFDSTHGFDELLVADYGFVDAKLAGVYGVSGVEGTELVLAPFADGRRAGVLGQASVLTAYAHSDQSSPIKRGVFVRERLLCQKFGTPPPDAGGLPVVDPNATTRERFAMHTARESCRGCHQYIDGVGFGFERFDAIGRWRESENGQPIDASGDVTDVEGFGTHTSAPFSSLPELARVLAASNAAKSCFVKQYWRFTLGALETSEDRCTLDDLEARFRASGYDIRELMIAVTQSPSFVLRR